MDFVMQQGEQILLLFEEQWGTIVTEKWRERCRFDVLRKTLD